MTRSTLLFLVLCGILHDASAFAAGAEATGCKLKTNEAFRAAASYTLPDGTVRVVTGDGVARLVSEFNREFVKLHPAIRFELQSGQGVSAMDGLTAGVSAFAVLPRAAWPMERRPFRQAHGYEAAGIVIGRVGFVQSGRPNPPAAYVNSLNPLRGITLEQLGRIVTSGAPDGDISHWRQLTLAGNWAERRIHVYGRRDDGTALTGLRHEIWQARPLAPHFEPLHDDGSIIAAIAEDPYGIAILGTALSQPIPHKVRFLPLAAREGGEFSDGSYEEVLEGKYPLAPFLHVYFDRQPGKPLDPMLDEYLQFMLSEPGQGILSGFSSREEGFVPLAPGEVSLEMAKLHSGSPQEVEKTSDWSVRGRPLPASQRPPASLDEALLAYQPAPSITLQGEISGSAPTILPDLAKRWVSGFRQYHPDARITIDPPFEAPQGSKSAQLSAFLDGKLEFAFLTRIMTQSDKTAFRRAHGTDPIVIPVSGGSFNHFGFVDAVAVVVHQSNPIEQLTLEQLDAVYSSTRRRGGSPITKWGELGLSGAWATRPIHVLGIPPSIAEESARAAFVRERILDVGGTKGAWRVPDGSDAPPNQSIEAAVSNDPCAIGFTGLGHLRAGLKALGLAENGTPAVFPTYESVADWEYPLAREIYMVLSRPREASRGEFLGEFLKYILSRDGQGTVAAQGVFLPLRQAQVNESLKFLRAANLGHDNRDSGVGLAISRARP